MKKLGVWLSVNRACAALGMSKKKWVRYATGYPAREGTGRAGSQYPDYFIPLQQIPATVRPGYEKMAVYAEWPDPPGPNVVDGSELDINAVLKTGDVGFDLQHELRRARKEKLQREVQWLDQKLQARRAELFAEWTQIFSEEIFQALAALKNAVIEMRLTESQTAEFKAALDQALRGMDQRLQALADRGYRKLEEQDEAAEG